MLNLSILHFDLFGQSASPAPTSLQFYATLILYQIFCLLHLLVLELCMRFHLIFHLLLHNRFEHLDVLFLIFLFLLVQLLCKGILFLLLLLFFKVLILNIFHSYNNSREDNSSHYYYTIVIIHLLLFL